MNKEPGEIMKLFMVCETLSEETAQTTQPIEVATNLKRFGHEIIFFAPRMGKYNKNEKINIKYVPTIDIFMLRSFVYQFFLFIYMFIYHLKFKPNLVHTRMGVFSIVPMLFSKIFGLPHVLHLADDIVEDMNVQNTNSSLITIYKVIEKINCTHSSKITTTTPNIKYALHKRWNTPLNRIITIPNGANTDLFKPMNLNKARKELDFDQNSHYIVFVGSLVVWQGVEYLIKSAPMILDKCPDVRFLIVGNGTMRGDLEALAEEIGMSNNFIFTGTVPYEDVPKYINASDVCVVPKKPLNSGYSPLKLFEYLACSKSVVASRISGFEILEQINAGILVEPENPEELANAITKLLKDEKLREEMGGAGRIYVVKNHSWKTVARNVANVCEDAVEKHKIGSR